MPTREPFSKKTRFEVYKRDSFTCQYCGAKAPEVLLVIDHINPVAKGGRSDILNLITSCQSCNAGKGARKISDNSEISKQNAQLALLNEKRQQLKLMLEWRKELECLDLEKALALYNKIVAICDHRFFPSDHGCKTLKGLVKKYPLEELLDAVSESFEKYFLNTDEEEPAKESWANAFTSIEKVLRWRRIKRDNPIEGQVRYIAGICANRFGEYRRLPCLQLLRTAADKNVDLVAAKRIVLEIRSWAQFRDSLENFIEHRSGGQECQPE